MAVRETSDNRRHVRIRADRGAAVDLAGVHGNDERISIDNVRRGVTVTPEIAWLTRFSLVRGILRFRRATLPAPGNGRDNKTRRR
jgi:hypothetical protein